jgi:hypothetical protein
MITTMIPVQLPESLFQRLKRVAELTHRSVEEIAATTLEAALPLASDVPPEIANELTAMHLFSDEALWAATAPCLSPTEETRLTQLNSAAAARALTALNRPNSTVSWQRITAQSYAGRRLWHFWHSAAIGCRLHRRAVRTMAGADVPEPLRQAVRERARGRCEYCLTSEVLSGIRCQIDHITSRGPTRGDHSGESLPGLCGLQWP